jgi:hypothetical protein
MKSIRQRRIEELRILRSQLSEVFTRIERLGKRIDQVFDYEPIRFDLPPDAPANIRRFNVYVEQHRRLLRLFDHAQELWMAGCLMELEDYWVPIFIEGLRRRVRQQAIGSARRHRSPQATRPSPSSHQASAQAPIRPPGLGVLRNETAGTFVFRNRPGQQAEPRRGSN